MSASCPIAFLTGDRETAIRQLEHVAGLVQTHNLQRWARWLRAYRKIIIDEAGAEGLADEFKDARGVLLDYLVTLAGDRALPRPSIGRWPGKSAGATRTPEAQGKSIAGR